MPAEQLPDGEYLVYEATLDPDLEDAFRRWWLEVGFNELRDYDQPCPCCVRSYADDCPDDPYAQYVTAQEAAQEQRERERHVAAEKRYRELFWELLYVRTGFVPEHGAGDLRTRVAVAQRYGLA